MNRYEYKIVYEYLNEEALNILGQKGWRLLFIGELTRHYVNEKQFVECHPCYFIRESK